MTIQYSNITDKDRVRFKQLQDIIDKQKKYEELVASAPGKLGTKANTDYIMRMSVYMTQELNEMLYELPWFKTWSKKYESWSEDKMKEQYDKAREEFIDTFIFMLNIASALGIDSEMWDKLFYMKNKINIERQHNNY